MRKEFVYVVVYVSSVIVSISASDWSKWSRCSVTCGTGLRVRKRPCEKFELGCNSGENVEQTKECSLPPCGGLHCYEGISTHIDGFETINTFALRKCSDIPYAPSSKDPKGREGLFCSTTTITVERNGMKYDMIQGSCLNQDLCDEVNCDRYKKLMGFYKIVSCEVQCCGRDRCNNPNRFKSKPNENKTKDDSAAADPCSSNPCKNFGSCISSKSADGKMDYMCACPPNFTGKNCSEAATKVCHTGVSSRTEVVPLSTPMLTTYCKSATDKCMVASVGSFKNGKPLYVDTAQCISGNLCESLKCSDLKKIMGSFEIKSCKIQCCDDDYCNTAPTQLPPLPTTTPYAQATLRATQKTKPVRKTTRKPPIRRKTTGRPQVRRTTRRTPVRRTTRRAQIRTTPQTTPVTTVLTTTVDTSGPHWSQWRDWQMCTHRCGDFGTRRRFRFCMKGAPGMPGCMPQDGSQEVEPCNRDVSCIRWREWGNWQSCSRSCGGGIRERRRSCDGGAPGTGDCLGTDIEQEPCSEQPCEIPAKWRDWGNWQSCSRTCGGGVRERRRSCEGGAPNTGECMGSDKEEENCNQQRCQPPSTAAITTTQSTRPPQRARRWGEWSDFSECSKTCDQGTMVRTRTCIGGRPGQLGCRNGARQTRKCNNGQCTTTTESTTTTIATTTQRPRGWDLWSDWMPCSVSCGDGTTTRSRECVGGRPGQKGCRGKRQEKKNCGSPCPVATATSAFAAACMERDGRRARISGRRCPSECSADRDCDQDEKCVCDGFCGKTCQDPSKSCLDLQTNPAGTIVTCSNKNSVGSVCAFSCEDEYVLQGNSNVFCQGNSKWTNQKKLPRCEKSEESSSETTPACTFAKRAHDACCGKKSYNSRSAKCCNGKVSPGGPAATECCGTRPYDPKKRGCCKTKLFRLPNQKCQNGKVRKNE